MARVTVDQDGRLVLPPDLCRRLRLEVGDELLVEQSDRGFMLHTIRPTVRKVCLELTTRCNLHCRACVRHVWDDPQSDMSVDTFDHVLDGLLAQAGEPLHVGKCDRDAAVRYLERGGLCPLSRCGA